MNNVYNGFVTNSKRKTDMDYFGKLTGDALKTEYRKLASRMHPDRGGDTSLFQEMQRQYECRKVGEDPFAKKPKTSKQTSETSHYKGSRVTVRGRARIYPNEVASDSAYIRDREGNRWNFTVNDMKQGHEFALRKTSMHGEPIAAILTAKFVVPETLRGEVILTYDDCLNKGCVSVRLSYRDTFFCDFKLNQLNRFTEHFLTERDAIIRFTIDENSSADIIRYHNRPNLKWEFEAGVVIRVILKRKDRNIFRRTWNYLKSAFYID